MARLRYYQILGDRKGFLCFFYLLQLVANNDLTDEFKNENASKKNR